MSLDTTKIDSGKVVTFRYVLSDDDGTIIDRSDEGMPYLHGAGNIVPGLERELQSRSVGDKFRTTIQPADGYGERTAPVQRIPREAFPDDLDIEVGMQFVADAGEGPIPLWVVGTSDGAVEVDMNHPLAGIALTFDVEVLAIRDATAEELEHGHPHGPDGHHHH